MKKMCAIFTMLIVVNMGLSAADKTWVGTDGDWEKATNWSPEGVPTAEDVAIISSTSSLTIGSDTVADSIRVTGTAVLTLNVTHAVELKVYVQSTAKLQVTGAGTLTLIPAEGANKGTISVLSGNVIFRQNAETPSMFGELTLADGVNATIADSSATNRHGMLLKHYQWANSSTAGGNYNHIRVYGWMNAFWKTGEVAAAVWTATTNTTIPVGCADTKFFMLPYQVGDYYSSIGRGIAILTPYQWEEKVPSAFYFHNKGSIFLDERGLIEHSYVSKLADETMIIGQGLHDFAFAHHGDYYGHHMEMHFHTTKNEDGLLHPDMLWNGVCFNGLNIAEGATLTISSGQAVGFVFGSANKINGRIVGGADTFCSLLGGTMVVADTDARLSEFHGTFEVGRNACLRPESSSQVGKYAFPILNYGTFTIPAQTTWDITDGTFYGYVEIEKGGTCLASVATAEDTEFLGEGDLILEGEDVDYSLCAGSFNGKLITSEGAVWGVVDDMFFGDNGNIMLTDNGTLAFEYTSAVSKMVSTNFVVPNFTSGMWMTNGIVQSTASLATGVHSNPNNPNPVIVNEDTVVMTDDVAQQRVICLTNVLVSLDDPWEASFTFSVRDLGFYSAKGIEERAAEGLSFTITPDIPTYADDQKVGKCPKNSEGIYFRTYTVDQKRLWWVRNGIADGNGGYTVNEMNGINHVSEPVDVRVSYDGKKYMTVELMQNGKTFSASRAISVADVRRVRPYYFTILSETGWWGDLKADGTPQVRPACYHIVSNFTATITRMKNRDVRKLDAFAIDNDNWELTTALNKNNVVSDKNNTSFHIEVKDGKLIFPNDDASLFSAYCKTPIKFSQPWRASFVHEITDFSTLTPRETFAILIHTNGPSTFGQLVGDGKAKMFVPPNAYGVVLTHNNNCIWYVRDSAESKGVDGVDKFWPNALLKFDRNAQDRPITTELIYDGNGLLKVTMTQATSTPGAQASTYGFEINIGKPFASDQDVYFGFSGRMSNTEHRPARNIISDFSFEVCDPCEITFSPGLAVADDSSATLALGAITDGNISSVKFPELSLGSGSALSLPARDEGRSTCRATFETVYFPEGGNACIDSGIDAVELSRLVFNGTTPVLSTLVGRFAADELELVVPQAWTKRVDTRLLDIRGVIWEGGKIPVFSVVDSEGHPVNVEVTTSGGIVRLLSQGMIFLLR